MAILAGKTKTLETIIDGHQLYSKIRQLVWNQYQIDVTGVSMGGRDTDFIYQLQIDSRTTKTRAAEIESFVKGVIACWKSF